MTEIAVDAPTFEQPSAAAEGQRAQSLGRAGHLLVFVLGSTWTFVVAAAAIRKHAELVSHRFDLGNIVQAVWSTAHGRPLEMTDGTAGEQIVRLGAHVDPILVLFTPLWWLYPSPDALIVGYVAAIATGIYPVVRLALKYTGSRSLALWLGGWYLLLPWTVWMAFNELNPLSLSLPLLLYAVWFLDEDRLGWFSLVALLALTTGELMGLTIAALGVWYAIRSRRLLTGAAIAAGGALWTVVCLAFVIPFFSNGSSSRYYERFDHVGGSPSGLLRTVVTSPGTVLAEFTSEGDLKFLVWAFLPAAFVCFVAPAVLLVALPQVGVSMLAESPAIASAVHHTAAPIVAALVAGSILGIARFPNRLRVVVVTLMMIPTFLLLAASYPRPGVDDYYYPRLESAVRETAMREALALIPEKAGVSATNRLGAQVSARRVVNLFPATRGASWLVLDVRDPSNTANWIGPVPFDTALTRLDRDRRWSLILDREGIRVYRMKGR